MSCGRRQCKRTVRTTSLFCRCGAEFCSETCFVAEWHLDHHGTCPSREEINADVAEARSKSDRTGMALLVSIALTKAPPPPAPYASAEPELPAVARSPAAATTTAEIATPAFGTQQEEEEEEAVPSDATRGETTPVAEPRPPALLSAAPPPQEPAESKALCAPGSGSGGLPAKAVPSDATTRSPASSISSETVTPEGPTERKRREYRRYKLEDFLTLGDPLGNGSYGSVTKVVHKPTAEIFAMKAIPKKKVLEHQMTDYLWREVKTQIRLQHPNIVRLHYYFEDFSNVYLLLEYADGGSLFSVMRKKGRIPEEEAAKYFVHVAGALHHLHRHDIVHRDLKPENILMAGAVAKLADFGWCAELEKDVPRHTFCGTWDYLSPEMVGSEPHDASVDVWAMGVLLYEMLSGRPPFAAANQMKAIERIMKVDLQFPETIQPLARELICKLLVRDPKQRLGLPEAVRHAWVHQYLPDADISRLPEASPSPSLLPNAAATAPKAEKSVSKVDDASSGLRPAVATSSKLAVVADGPPSHALPVTSSPKFAEGVKGAGAGPTPSSRSDAAEGGPPSPGRAKRTETLAKAQEVQARLAAIQQRVQMACSELATTPPAAAAGAAAAAAAKPPSPEEVSAAPEPRAGRSATEEAAAPPGQQLDVAGRNLGKEQECLLIKSAALVPCGTTQQLPPKTTSGELRSCASPQGGYPPSGLQHAEGPKGQHWHQSDTLQTMKKWLQASTPTAVAAPSPLQEEDGQTEFAVKSPSTTVSRSRSDGEDCSRVEGFGSFEDGGSRPSRPPLAPVSKKSEYDMPMQRCATDGHALQGHEEEAEPWDYYRSVQRTMTEDGRVAPMAKRLATRRRVGRTNTQPPEQPGASGAVSSMSLSPPLHGGAQHGAGSGAAAALGGSRRHTSLEHLATPRLDEVRHMAGDVASVRKRIDAELDGSCRALEQRLATSDFRFALDPQTTATAPPAAAAPALPLAAAAAPPSLPRGRGWVERSKDADAKEDLERMKESYRGQLDRLINRLESSPGRTGPDALGKSGLPTEDVRTDCPRKKFGAMGSGGSSGAWSTASTASS